MSATEIFFEYEYEYELYIPCFPWVVFVIFIEVNILHWTKINAMVLRRRLAVTVLSLCGGAAAGTAFYVLRSRHEVHDKPVTTPTNGDMTLKNVQIFFRHGARTPLTNISGLDEVWMSKYFVFIYRKTSDRSHRLLSVQVRTKLLSVRGALTNSIISAAGPND